MSTNYIAEFYKNTDRNYEDFFSSYVDTNAIFNLNKDIKALNAQLEEKKEELSRLYVKRYNSQFTPIEKRLVLRYESKVSADSYFDVMTGYPVDDIDDETCKILIVARKTGSFEATVGYCLPLGAIIVRKYTYRIATNNSKCVFNLVYEALVPVLDYEANVVRSDGERSPKNIYSINGDDFIGKMYGIPNFNAHIQLSDFENCLKNNASTEIILKTAPMDCMRTLLSFKTDKAEPIYKMLDLTKEIYDSLIEKGYLKEFILVMNTIENSFGEKCNFSSYRNKDYSANDFFHYTKAEWVDIIEKSHYWTEELNFNQVNYNDDYLSLALLKAYVGWSYNFRTALFFKHYSFGKFMDYVCEESCNQGFQSLDSFMTELHDYLSMCETMSVKPSLYTCYLKQTHDILTRNYKINPTEAQKVSFARHYADYKDYTTKDKEYVVTHPSTVEDVKEEGYNLNHCVASYILKCCQGVSRILFLRKAKTATQSLVTIEIVNKSIVQARGASNRPINTNEFEAICEFAKERKLNVRVSPRD